VLARVRPAAAASVTPTSLIERKHAMEGSAGASCAQDIPRAERIARLNDTLRKTGTGGAIMVTRGVRELPQFNVLALLAALAAFDSFDADNDPHGERDFGDLSFAGRDLLWKIDYYDFDLRYGSNDPADPAVTKRVLTVMLPDEW
jgi:hypothetical protein